MVYLWYLWFAPWYLWYAPWCLIIYGLFMVFMVCAMVFMVCAMAFMVCMVYLWFMCGNYGLCYIIWWLILHLRETIMDVTYSPPPFCEAWEPPKHGVFWWFWLIGTAALSLEARKKHLAKTIMTWKYSKSVLQVLKMLYFDVFEQLGRRRRRWRREKNTSLTPKWPESTPKVLCKYSKCCIFMFLTNWNGGVVAGGAKVLQKYSASTQKVLCKYSR